MPTLKQYIKSTTELFGSDVWLPLTYSPTKTYRIIFFIHGIGECASGSKYYLDRLAAWIKGNSFLLDYVDKYDFILVAPNYLNTTGTSGEKPRVCKWILERMLSLYPAKTDSVTFIGHSNGAHTLMTYAFLDNDFSAKVTNFVPSSSGPVNALTFPNIANNCRTWGICAIGDKTTSYNNTAQLADKLPAINPRTMALVTIFPTSRWSSDVNPHDMTLGQLTKSPPAFVTLSGITKGLAGAPKMDLYQWIISNPRGSVPQLPDHAFVGPKYEGDVPVEPTPTPTPTGYRDIIRVVVTGRAAGDVVTQITWSDGHIDTLKAATGDVNLGTSINFKTRTVALDYKYAANGSVPWTQKVPATAKRKAAKKKKNVKKPINK